MKTIEVKGFVLAQKNWRDDLEYTFSTIELIEHGYMTVCPHTLTFQLPEGFDPIAAQIAMLQQQRDKLRAEVAKRITEINDQISKLQALPYEPADTPAEVDLTSEEIPF